MITLAQARARAAARLRSHLRQWATDVVPEGEPGGVLVSIPLAPPSETEVRHDERAAEEWTREWTSASLPAGATLTTVVRSWRSIGRQTVPLRLELSDAEAVARFAGGTPARDFAVLRARSRQAVERLAAEAPATPAAGPTDKTTNGTAELDPGRAVVAALRAHGAVVLGLMPERWEEVLAVSGWLATRSVAGLRPRSLPIRGVDTKWFTAHRSLVTALVTAVTGRADLGVVTADRLVRVRVLDPGLAQAGLTDLAAPLTELARLDLVPRVVLVLENLETLLALPSMPGIVAAHGGGMAVDGVLALPWVRRVPVLYWGDLDAAGFAILHRARAHHPDVTSVLMDSTTLLAHRDLWVGDPRPSRAVLGHLTPQEAQAYARLCAEGDVRLEQERIPLAHALAVIAEALGRRLGPSAGV